MTETASAPISAHQYNPMRPSLLRRLIAAALVWVVKGLIRTFRVSLYGPEPPQGRPIVFAFLHGQQMGLLRHPRPNKTVVLTSMSQDGTLQASVLGALGFDIIRGSSSRGGDAGLFGLIRAMKKGAAAALAVDGPRGPKGVVKPGAIFIANATRGVVIPVTCAASRSWHLSKSWDSFLIPAPWSRVVLVRGAPLGQETKQSEEGEGALRAKLEEELLELTKRAEELANQQHTEIHHEGRKR